MALVASVGKGNRLRWKIVKIIHQMRLVVQPLTLTVSDMIVKLYLTLRVYKMSFIVQSLTLIVSKMIMEVYLTLRVYQMRLVVQNPILIVSNIILIYLTLRVYKNLIQIPIIVRDPESTINMVKMI